MRCPFPVDVVYCDHPAASARRAQASIRDVGSTHIRASAIAEQLRHAAAGRAAKPFLAVNIGALPENLAAAEIFGHESGAFTGATQNRDGFAKLVRRQASLRLAS
jgi:transcriptional regulator of acetoin/glycerol metabolism